MRRRDAYPFARPPRPTLHPLQYGLSYTGEMWGQFLRWCTCRPGNSRHMYRILNICSITGWRKTRRTIWRYSHSPGFQDGLRRALPEETDHAIRENDGRRWLYTGDRCARSRLRKRFRHFCIGKNRSVDLYGFCPQNRHGFKKSRGNASCLGLLRRR